MELCAPEIEQLETELTFKSDYRILHLNFPKYANENSIIWSLGQYVDFIEEELLLKKTMFRFYNL